MSTEKISGMTASDPLIGSEFFEISQLIGGIRRTRRTNLNAVGDYINSYLELGTAATADVQTSATDTTAGRLMAVGAFGVGGRNVSDFDADALGLASGFYSFNSGSGLPSTRVVGIYSTRSLDGRSVQLGATDEISSKIVFRYRGGGGSWQTWRTMWDDSNLSDPATLSGNQTFTDIKTFRDLRIDRAGVPAQVIRLLTDNLAHWVRSVDGSVKPLIIHQDDDSQEVRIRVGTTDRVLVNSNGNVRIGTGTATEKLDIDGNFKLSGYQVRGSELQEQTGGTKDNYAIGNNDSVEVALTSGTSVTFTGLAGGTDGRVVTVRRSLWSITFNHDDAGSTSTNRFNLRGNANLTLSDDNTSATFIYRASRWHLLSLI